MHMPAVMDPPEPHLNDVAGTQLPAPLPDASVLEDKTPPWMRTPSVSALFVVVIGVIFVIMANRPLHHTDLWDHLNYGRVVLQDRSVFQTEPLLSLAQGIPMVNVPWLAQVGLNLLNDRFGLSSLQFVYGLLISLSLGIIAWRTTKRSGSVVSGMIAVFVFFALNFQQFLVIRPQLVGVLFFSITAAWSLAHRRFSRLTWIGMPLMFAFWANCHASFSTGLLLLGLTGIGRFLDIWVRTRSLKAAVTEPQFDRIILLTQLCAAAVLLNPWGLAVYGEVFKVASNPNITSMFEWSPLNLHMKQGQWATVMTLVLLFALKVTPRRVRFVEIVPLVVTGLLAMWSARMINWWAPLMAICIGTHLPAAFRLWRKQQRRTEPYRATGLWTVVNAGICWVLFACTTFGIQLVHGKVAEPSRMMSSGTPFQLARNLQRIDAKNGLPKGIAFIPAEWAGYVMNAGPASVRPMVNLHVHVIPPEVWSDYLRILNGPSDWDHLLDQYGINLVIIDKDHQPGLLKRLVGSEDWSAVYADNQGAVFFRKKPL
jgi:hypothetical protein